MSFECVFIRIMLFFVVVVIDYSVSTQAFPPCHSSCALRNTQQSRIQNFVSKAQVRPRNVMSKNGATNLLTQLRGGGNEVTCISSILPSLTVLQKRIASNPLVQNSLVCLGLWTAGDILAQVMETNVPSYNDKSKSFNIARTCHVASFGMIVSGPLFSIWYPFLEKSCQSWTFLKGGDWSKAIAKMLVEMFLLEPVFILIFYSYMTAVEGGTLQEYKHKMSSQYIPTYKMSLSFWPAFMVLQFRFVPVAAQTVFINAAMLFWDAFLSYRNNKAQ